MCAVGAGPSIECRTPRTAIVVPMWLKEEKDITSTNILYTWTAISYNKVINKHSPNSTKTASTDSSPAHHRRKTSSQAMESEGTVWADFGATSTKSTGATATALTAGAAGYITPAVVTPPPAAKAEEAEARSAEDCRSSIESVEALFTPTDENEDDGVIEVEEEGAAEDRAAVLDVVEPVVTGAEVENITGPRVKLTRGTLEELNAVVVEVAGAAVVVKEVRRGVTKVVEVVILLTNTGGVTDLAEVDSLSRLDSELKSGISATARITLAEVGAASRGRAVVNRHE